MSRDDNDALPDDATVARITNRGAGTLRSQHALCEYNVYSRFLLARARWEDGLGSRAAQEGPS